MVIKGMFLKETNQFITLLLMMWLIIGMLLRTWKYNLLPSKAVINFNY